MSNPIFADSDQATSTRAFLDASAFDEKFVIELRRDYIYNVHHVENKYHVPILSGGFRELYEYVRKHLIHRDDRHYAEFMNPDTLEQRLADSPTPGIIKSEFREKLVDGSFRWVQYVGIAGAEHGVPEGEIHFYVFDIQNQKDRMEGAVSTGYNRAKRDEVTGLRIGENFIEDAMQLAREGDGPWCCVALDIQNFEVFNLWFGHEQGTYLLVRLGQYLLDFEREANAIAAYFGHDNFALFMPHDEALVRRVYQDVRDIVYSLGNTAGFLPALGVCVLARNEQPKLDVYDRARMMVADAKKTYTDRIAYFNSQVFFRARENYEQLTEFQRALRNDEIGFYVQPQCNVATGKILSAEALARWSKPDGTVVGPAAFVPVLESTGLITMLDQCIWEQVCKWLRDLLDRGLRALPISVNVSQIDILSLDVVECFTHLIALYDIPASLIKVEITESAYASSFDLISGTIQRLKDAGFVVMLDDFGSGYSSLNMLDQVNVDILKLDMAFMQKDSSLTKKGMSIIESIMGMTKALEIPVVVEGLEDADQAAFLEELGCKYAQGYYFYPPLNLGQFEALLADETAIDERGFSNRVTDFFHANEFLQGHLFNDITLNRILGPAAYYSLEGENLTITRFNEQFHRAIGDEKMERRVENIQNFVPAEDHPLLYRALQEAQDNVAEGGSCEIRFWKSDGSLFWFRMEFYFLKDDGVRKQFFGQVEDISESREQGLSFFEVLHEQSDVSMRMDLDGNVIQYVTSGHTLNQIDLPSMPLDVSIEQTAMSRIESEADRKAFRDFFSTERLREAYRKAVYHEVLDIDFRLNQVIEPIEFSTYYIRYSKAQSLTVYAFARRRDRVLLERDALTGLGNRHLFNESVRAMEARPELFDNLIVFSLDVNGLKTVNDLQGHTAGDEMIRGAAACVNQVMSPYGKCFRTGGDEFVAFVYGDTQLAETLQDELENVLSEWKGTHVESLTISSGWAAASAYPPMSIAELMKAADREMYRAKSRHYQQKGVDRRVQQAAYNALCDSYAKILKVDLVEDRFELIRAEDSELNAARGYRNHLSTWLEDFAAKGQVHPDDKQSYLENLAIDKLRRYFAEGGKRYITRYRRLYEGEFRTVMLEVMPAPDYAEESQNVFLYVKILDD